MTVIGFYLDVVQALEEIHAPYMLVGAFAASTYGLSRATFDLDILVDLQSSHFGALASRFPPPRYYADPVQMRDSTRLGIMFNIIDVELGAKADLVPLTREPEYRQAFQRRIRRTFQNEIGAQFEAWCAGPEDLIIGKLRAWMAGHSTKHPADIHAILIFGLSGLGDESIDLEYVTNHVAALGKPVMDLWERLKQRAQASAQHRFPGAEQEENNSA
jgi:hypothetical protein